MEKKSLKAELYIRPEAKAMTDGRNFSLEGVMRILGHLIIISILHRYDGVLIHSSGVILNGEGVIFAGISGAGKTTISKLWRERDGVAILSDDRIIIRKERSGYFAYGTPWPGEGERPLQKGRRLKRYFSSPRRKITQSNP